MIILVLWWLWSCFVLFVSRLFLSSFVIYFVAWCSFISVFTVLVFVILLSVCEILLIRYFCVSFFVICWVFVTFWFLFLWVGVSSFIHEKRDREISSPNSHWFCWTDDLPLQLLKLKNLNIFKRSNKKNDRLSQVDESSQNWSQASCILKWYSSFWEFWSNLVNVSFIDPAAVSCADLQQRVVWLSGEVRAIATSSL